MELQDIVKYHAEDGDVLFVNADAINVSVLKQLDIAKRVIIIPVHCEPGVSVSDSVATLSVKTVSVV